MSDYLKSTNFSTKDTLPSGNASKIVKGTELDTEFNAIASSSASKADILNPVFSGLLTTDTLVTTGAANIGGTLAASGTFSAAADVQFTGTGRVLVPSGTTGQRPASPTTGSVRFNTTLGFLENYNGTEWRLVAPDPTPAQVSNQLNTSTGYFQVPVGTTGQRLSPSSGLIRYNTSGPFYEGYVNGSWVKFVVVNQGSYTITYLVAGAGGGGGVGGAGGGGGGSGAIAASTTGAVPGTTVLTMTVGGGGAQATAGSASSIAGIATSNAGSGGGNAPTAFGGAGGSSGSGYGGGNGGENVGGGGGGGTGGAGTSGTSVGGIGGAGTNSVITGSSVDYAGGGGGGGGGGAGTGGAGSAGGGQGQGGTAAGAGTANSGSGGGGSNTVAGGNGGSGVIILSMPTASYSGTHTGSPTVITSGANTILKYTGSGTYTA